MPNGHHAPRVRFGPFDLDVRERELRRDGQRVRLLGKPFDLLVALVEHRGELVTREELRRRLWTDDTFVAFDENLNAAVRKLRDVLGDSAVSPTYIETVPRHGYRFIAPVEVFRLKAEATEEVGRAETTGEVGRPEAAGQVGPAELAAPREAASAPDAGERTRERRRAQVLLASAAASVVLAATLALTWWIFSVRREPSPELVQLQVRTAEGTIYPPGVPRVVVSPDGRQVAFLAVSTEQVRSVWVQSLDAPAPRRVPGTEHAWGPFWSPDSREIVFTVHSTLYRIGLDGGAATPIADAGDASGGTWSRESGILIPQRSAGGLVRISPESGARETVTQLDGSRGETRHVWPQFLADGRSFLYLALADAPGKSGIYLARPGDAGRTRLVDANFKAIYAPPGLLLFVRGTTLYAQPFDVAAGRLYGDPYAVASNIPVLRANGAAGFSASEAGVLAHAQPNRRAQRQLVWVNRAGQHLEQIGSPSAVASFALSADQRSVIVEEVNPANQAPDLWLVDLPRGTRTRLTENRANDESPAWGPGPGQFTYARHRAIHQVADIYVARPHVRNPHRLLLPARDDSGSLHPAHWSADGRFLLYERHDGGGKRDIWIMSADGRDWPWLATRFDEKRPRFSPDGRWIAFESDRTGRPEAYVGAFGDPHTLRRVSDGGGDVPEWRGDGLELFYLGSDFRLMSVRVRPGPDFQSDAPRALFEVRRLAASPRTPTPYAVSADGQRFLMALVTDEGGDSPIQVVLNWTALLARGRSESP